MSSRRRRETHSISGRCAASARSTCAPDGARPVPIGIAPALPSIQNPMKVADTSLNVETRRRYIVVSRLLAPPLRRESAGVDRRVHALAGLAAGEASWPSLLKLLARSEVRSARRFEKTGAKLVAQGPLMAAKSSLPARSRAKVRPVGMARRHESVYGGPGPPSRRNLDEL